MALIIASISVHSQPHRGEKLAEFQAHRECVTSCKFLCHDTIVMTSSFDKTIAFWVSV